MPSPIYYPYLGVSKAWATPGDDMALHKQALETDHAARDMANAIGTLRSPTWVQPCLICSVLGPSVGHLYIIPTRFGPRSCCWPTLDVAVKGQPVVARHVGFFHDMHRHWIFSHLDRATNLYTVYDGNGGMNHEHLKAGMAHWLQNNGLVAASNLKMQDVYKGYTTASCHLGGNIFLGGPSLGDCSVSAVYFAMAVGQGVDLADTFDHFQFRTWLAERLEQGDPPELGGPFVNRQRVTNAPVEEKHVTCTD